MSTQRKQYQVVGPHEGPSFWQPRPANGYVIVKASPKMISTIGFSQGIQVLPAKSFVRNHVHSDQDEVIYCLEGTGIAIIDETEYEMGPGATFVIGRGTSHTFLNNNNTELKFIWTISPSGLEKFFQSIGLPKSGDEPAPENFDRPSVSSEIDRQHRLLSE